MSPALNGWTIVVISLVTKRLTTMLIMLIKFLAYCPLICLLRRQNSSQLTNWPIGILNTKKI